MEARTVIVGDVHGCADELASLVQQVGRQPGDRWVFVGDLVGRGPDTPGVLEQVRQLGAQVALGNHEHRVLAAYEAREAGRAGPSLGPGHLALLDRLGPEDWALLRAMKPYLELPEHGLIVVHAGLDPRLPLPAQRLEVLIHMRSWDYGEPSARFREESWASDYPGPTHVVFGHNARLGLQLHPHATGVDSGCVYGERLSALVLGPGERPLPPAERHQQIHQVKARRQYYGG
ncbi:MAG: metallophosphoesterase [Polyangiaceae bacterium]|nr:metallophosphoesterase [Polyangiaceae bacterium]MCW5790667.1 metallophosphoesterase [Polyangiaceae bacterium]